MHAFSVLRCIFELLILVWLIKVSTFKMHCNAENGCVNSIWQLGFKTAFTTSTTSIRCNRVPPTSLSMTRWKRIYFRVSIFMEIKCKCPYLVCPFQFDLSCVKQGEEVSLYPQPPAKQVFNWPLVMLKNIFSNKQTQLGYWEVDST